MCPSTSCGDFGECNEHELLALRIAIAAPHDLAARIVEIAVSNARLLCRTGALIVRREGQIGFSDEEAAATREVMR